MINIINLININDTNIISIINITTTTIIKNICLDENRTSSEKLQTVSTPSGSIRLTGFHRELRTSSGRKALDRHDE